MTSETIPMMIKDKTCNRRLPRLLKRSSKTLLKPKKLHQLTVVLMPSLLLLNQVMSNKPKVDSKNPFKVDNKDQPPEEVTTVVMELEAEVETEEEIEVEEVEVVVTVVVSVVEVELLDQELLTRLMLMVTKLKIESKERDNLSKVNLEKKVILWTERTVPELQEEEIRKEAMVKATGVKMVKVSTRRKVLKKKLRRNQLPKLKKKRKTRPNTSKKLLVILLMTF